jgi:DNA-binding MarR family transcriptional regulator
MMTQKKDERFADAINILEESEIGAIWQICFIANIFTFPVYANFDKTHGISRMEFVVLYVTAHRANMMAWEICRITGLPRNNISRGVKKLEQKGLVSRATDPNDARRSLLNLTEKGKELYRELVVPYADRAETVLSLLDDSDRAALTDLTLRLSRKIALANIS